MADSAIVCPLCLPMASPIPLNCFVWTLLKYLGTSLVNVMLRPEVWLCVSHPMANWRHWSEL